MNRVRSFRRRLRPPEGINETVARRRTSGSKVELNGSYCYPLNHFEIAILYEVPLAAFTVTATVFEVILTVVLNTGHDFS
jgi:hypothetical protein